MSEEVKQAEKPKIVPIVPISAQHLQAAKEEVGVVRLKYSMHGRPIRSN